MESSHRLRQGRAPFNADSLLSQTHNAFFFQGASDNREKNVQTTHHMRNEVDLRAFFSSSVPVCQLCYMVLQFDYLKKALQRNVQPSDSRFITSTLLTLPENAFTLMSSQSCPGRSIAAVTQNRTQPTKGFLFLKTTGKTRPNLKSAAVIHRTALDYGRARCQEHTSPTAAGRGRILIVFSLTGTMWSYTNSSWFPFNTSLRSLKEFLTFPFCKH